MMVKKILEYKGNILYCVGILVILSLNVMFYSGVKEGYFNIFILAVIVAPMLVIIKTKNNIMVDFTFAVFIVLIISLYAIVFWKYKDGRFLNFIDISQIPQEARSQFSFENQLKLNLLFICSSITALISLLIRVFYYKFKIVKSQYS